MGAGHEAFWWTGTSWQVMSSQVWDPDTGCLGINFTNSTSPSIAQLNGTFAEI